MGVRHSHATWLKFELQINVSSIFPLTLEVSLIFIVENYADQMVLDAEKKKKRISGRIVHVL